MQSTVPVSEALNRTTVSILAWRSAQMNILYYNYDWDSHSVYKERGACSRKSSVSADEIDFPPSKEQMSIA